MLLLFVQRTVNCLGLRHSKSASAQQATLARTRFVKKVVTPKMIARMGRKCVPVPETCGDAVCPTGYSCVDDKCVAGCSIELVDDYTCTDGSTPEGDPLTCTCTGTLQCSELKCVECNDKIACDSGYECTNNKCVSSETCGDAVCPTGYSCVDDKCVAGCSIELVDAYTCTDGSTPEGDPLTCTCTEPLHCSDLKCVECIDSDNCPANHDCLDSKCFARCSVQLEVDSTSTCTPNSVMSDSWMCVCDTDFDCLEGGCAYKFIKCDAQVPAESEKPCTEFSTLDSDSNRCRCNAGYTCEDGSKCVTCDGECPECTLSEDCLLDHRCKDKVCEEGCDSKDDCADGKYCSEEEKCELCDGVCPCSDKNKCALGEICLEQTCYTACDEDDGDCPSETEYCKDGGCQPCDGPCPCVDSDSCGLNMHCIDSVCVRGCDDVGDCHDYQYCSSSTNTCLDKVLCNGIPKSDDFECTANSIADKVGQKCECDATYECNDKTGTCDKIVLGCNVDIPTDLFELECGENSHRLDNQCLCDTGFDCVEASCQRMTCETEENCETGLTCLKGLCQSEIGCNQKHDTIPCKEGTEKSLSDGTCVCSGEGMVCSDDNECVVPNQCSESNPCDGWEDNIICQQGLCVQGPETPCGVSKTFEEVKNTPCTRHSTILSDGNNAICTCDDEHFCTDGKCQLHAPECETDIDCGDFICSEEKKCVADTVPCGSDFSAFPDKQCAEDSSPNEMLNICECDDGFMCREGKCEIDCTATTDCSFGEECKEMECSQRHTGCKAPLFLGPISCPAYSFVVVDTENDLISCECRSGFTCSDALCLRDECWSCADDEVCVNNKCEKVNNNMCMDKSGCEEGLECIEGRCVDIKVGCEIQVDRTELSDTLCTDNSELVTEGMKCRCKVGYLCKDKKCEPDASLACSPEVGCEEGKSCVDNICQKALHCGMQTTDGFCGENSSPLGGVCTCNFPFECISQQCVNMAGRCGKRAATIEQEVEKDCVDNASQSAQGICECNPGYLCKSHFCVAMSKVPNACKTEAEVCVPNSQHNTDGICECNPPFSCDISGLCEDFTGTCGGTPRTSDTICNDNMQVSDSDVCICNPDYDCVERVCVAKAKTGKCGDYPLIPQDDSPPQCNSGDMFIAINGKCTCTYPYSCDTETGDCLNKAGKCGQPADGFLCDEFASRDVNNGLCVCDGGYVCDDSGDCKVDANAGKCEHPPSAGEVCGDNAIIVDHVCKCNLYYECIDETGECEPLVIEAKCGEAKGDLTCPSNSQAVDDICQCLTGFECSSDGLCRPIKPVSGKCGELPLDSGCLATNMNVVDGVCTCNSMLSCIDGECHDYTGLCGYSPTLTGDCITNAARNDDGICTCSSRYSCDAGECVLKTGHCDDAPTTSTDCYEHMEYDSTVGHCKCLTDWTCVSGYCLDSTFQMSWSNGRSIIEIERWAGPQKLQIASGGDSLGDAVRISADTNCESLFLNGDLSIASNSFYTNSEMTKELYDNLVICSIVGSDTTNWVPTSLRLTIRGIDVSAVNATRKVVFETSNSIVNTYVVDGEFLAPAIFYEATVAVSCEPLIDMKFKERLITNKDGLVVLTVPTFSMPKPGAEAIILTMCIRRIESATWHMTPVMFEVPSEELKLNERVPSDGPLSIARGVQFTYSYRLNGGGVNPGDLFTLAKECGDATSSAAQLSFDGDVPKLLITETTVSRLPTDSPLDVKLCRNGAETGFTFIIQDLTSDSTFVGTINGLKTLTLWYGELTSVTVEDREVPGAVDGMFIFGSIDGSCTFTSTDIMFIVNQNKIHNFGITGSVGRETTINPTLCESRDKVNFVPITDITVTLNVPTIDNFVVGDVQLPMFVVGVGEQVSPQITGTMDPLLISTKGHYTIFTIPVEEAQIQERAPYCNGDLSSQKLLTLLRQEEETRLVVDASKLDAGYYGICLSGDWGATAATMGVSLDVRLPVLNIDQDIVMGVGLPRDVFFTASGIGKGSYVLFAESDCTSLTSADLNVAIPVRSSDAPNNYYIPFSKQDVSEVLDLSKMCLFSSGHWYGYDVNLKVVQASITNIDQADAEKKVHVSRMMETTVDIQGIALDESIEVTFSVDCATATETSMPAISVGDITTLTIKVDKAWPADGSNLELKLCFWEAKTAYDGAPGFTIVVDTPSFTSWEADSVVLQKTVDNGFENTVEIFTAGASPLLPLWMGLAVGDCSTILYKFNVHFQTVDIDISDAASTEFIVCINYEANVFHKTDLTLTVSSELRVDSLIRQTALIYTVCETCTHAMTVEGSGLSDGLELMFAESCDASPDGEVVVEVTNVEKDRRGGLISIPPALVSMETVNPLKVCLHQEDGTWTETGITFVVVSELTPSTLTMISNTDHVIVPRGFNAQMLSVSGTGPAFTGAEASSAVKLLKLSKPPSEEYHFDTLIEDLHEFHAAVRQDASVFAGVSPHEIWCQITPVTENEVSSTKIKVYFPVWSKEREGEPVWSAVTELVESKSETDGIIDIGFDPSKTVKEEATCDINSIVQTVVFNAEQTSHEVSLATWASSEIPIIHTGICFATPEGVVDDVTAVSDWTLTDLTFSVSDLRIVSHSLSSGTHTIPIMEGYALESASIKLCDEWFKDFNVYIVCSNSKPSCSILSSGTLTIVEAETAAICLKTDSSNDYFEQVATVRLVPSANIYKIGASNTLDVQVGSDADQIYPIEGEGIVAGTFLLFESVLDSTRLWIPIQKIEGEAYAFGVQLPQAVLEKPNKFRACFSDDTCEGGNFVTVNVVSNEAESKMIIGLGDDNTSEHIVEHGVGSLPIHGSSLLVGRYLFLIPSDTASETPCESSSADYIKIREKDGTEYVQLSLGDTVPTGIYSICLEREVGADVFVRQENIVVNVDKDIDYNEVVCLSNSICSPNNNDGLVNNSFTIHQNVGGSVSFSKMRCELGCYIKIGECGDNTAPVVTLSTEGIMQISSLQSQQQMNHGQLCFSRDRYIFSPISVTITITPIRIDTIGGETTHFTMSQNTLSSLQVTGSIFGKVGVAFVGADATNCDTASNTNTFWLEGDNLLVPASFNSELVTNGRICVASSLLDFVMIQITYDIADTKALVSVEMKVPGEVVTYPNIGYAMLVIEITAAAKLNNIDMAITTTEACTAGTVDSSKIGHPDERTLYLTPHQLPSVDVVHTICYRVGNLPWVDSQIGFKLVDIKVSRFGTSTATSPHIIQAGNPLAVNIDISFESTGSSVEPAGEFLLSTSEECNQESGNAPVVNGEAAVFTLQSISEPGGPYFVCYRPSVQISYLKTDFTIEIKAPVVSYIGSTSETPATVHKGSVQATTVHGDAEAGYPTVYVTLMLKFLSVASGDDCEATGTIAYVVEDNHVFLESSVVDEVGMHSICLSWKPNEAAHWTLTPAKLEVITEVVIQKLGGKTEGTIDYIEGTSESITASGFDSVTSFGFSTEECAEDTIFGHLEPTSSGTIVLPDAIATLPGVYAVCLGSGVWTRSNWNINVIAAAITEIDNSQSVTVERDVWWRMNITSETHISVFFVVKFTANEDCTTETVIPQISIEQKDDFYWFQITRLASSSVEAKYLNKDLFLCLASRSSTQYRKQPVTIKVTSSAFAKLRYPSALTGDEIEAAKGKISTATDVPVDQISFQEKLVATEINNNRALQPLADYVEYIVKFIRLGSSPDKNATVLVAEIYELAKPGNELFEYFNSTGVIQVVTTDADGTDTTEPIVFVVVTPSTDAPATPRPDTLAPASDDSSDNMHLIIIIVCGAVLVLALTAYCCCRKRGRKEDAYGGPAAAGGAHPVTSDDGDVPVEEMSNIQAAAEV
eukprot:TRINITY_DN228_c0_g1_i3.p1 TRINITY_DN228_c0_g1~~TRINITY_DN228_c0_g1_i3.p1  ORF type:complete len:3809 (+),score=784.72 TRINITY_DN228_c0_g1_i3:1687-13113(+)